MKRLLAILALCLSLATAGHAQDYPNRLITVFVPFAGGSVSDTAA